MANPMFTGCTIYMLCWPHCRNEPVTVVSGVLVARKFEGGFKEYSLDPTISPQEAFVGIIQFGEVLGNP